MGCQRIEDVATPIIGRFYDVPFVYAKMRDGRVLELPILLPIHRDPELDVPELHAHIDWRFTHHPLNGTIELDSVQEPPRKPMLCLRPKAPWRYYRISRDTEVYRERKRFEDQFSHLVANLDAMVCPHRGVSLRAGRRCGSCVVCPAHAFAWSLKTGRMVRMAK